MASRPALRPVAAAGAVAGIVLAAWWVMAPREPMPPVSPIGDQPVYSVADEPRLPLLEPALHAAWSERSAIGAVLVPLVVIGAGSGLVVVAGASGAAALIVLLALALDASFGAALWHQSSLVVAVGLVWLAAAGAFSEPVHPGPRPWVRSLAAIGFWVLAVWWHWLALAAWPVVLAGLRRRPERSRWALWVAASVLAGLAALVAHLAWMAASAERQAFAPGLTLTWWDALIVAFDTRPRLPPGSFVSPDVTTRLPYLTAMLAAAGLAFATPGRWWRRAVTLTALLLGAIALAWTEWRADALRFGLWLLTPMAAMGLSWAARQAPSRRAGLATAAALGVILIAESIVASVRPLAGQLDRGFRDVLVGHLGIAASNGPVVIVAEDTRLDSALAAWAPSNAGVRRAPQNGAVVAEALSAGQTVLAGPVGRQQLLLAGVRFRDAFVFTDPAPYGMSEAEATFTCATVRPDRWSLLPGVEYTGRLGIEVPPRPGGEMLVIVGDALPLAVRVESPDGQFVPAVADALLSGPGGAAPPADYWLESGAPEDSPRLATRVHLPAHPVRSTLLSLRLGRRAPRVLARLSGFGESARGRVCAAPVGARLLFETAVTEDVRLDQHEAFGRGWYGIERAGEPFRFTDTDPVLLLRSAVRTGVEVALAADNADGADSADSADSADNADGANGAPVTVTLRVNGIDAGPRRMARGLRRYVWSVPAGVWLAGANELWWHVSRGVRPANVGGADTRELGMRVVGVTLSREPAPPPR